MEDGSVSSDRKEALRRHFAINEDQVFEAGDLQKWLESLGLMLNKRDVHETAEKLSEYMIEVKGYTTGEDFREVELGDIEEARANMKLPLSDVSARTIYRYMSATAQDKAHGTKSDATEAAKAG